MVIAASIRIALHVSILLLAALIRWYVLLLLLLLSCGLGIGSGGLRLRLRLGLRCDLLLGVEHGLLQGCAVVLGSGLEQEVGCVFLILVTRKVGFGSTSAAESERLKTLDSLVLVLGHLDRARRHLLTAATCTCGVGSGLGPSATSTHVGNCSLEEHHENLGVGLNRSVNVWLLLLEILHKHGGEVLVSEQPLTDSREAGVRNQGLQLLDDLWGEAGKWAPTSGCRVGLLLGVGLLLHGLKLLL